MAPDRPRQRARRAHRRRPDEARETAEGRLSGGEREIRISREARPYRGAEFARIFKDNERKLQEAVAAKKIEILLNSNVQEFREREAVLKIGRGGRAETVTVPSDHAFVLVGAELPTAFLKSLGLK